MPTGNNLGRDYRDGAINAPSPGAGEVRRTPLPDTFDGIRFEIGRMVKYVQDGFRDVEIIDASRTILGQYCRFVEEMSAREGNPIACHNNKVVQAEGLYLWCRDRYFYVNDPPGVEVIQTPKRMLRQTRIAKEVLQDVMEPFYRAVEQSDPSFNRQSYEPKPIFVGDCDEPCCLYLAMCAAVDIGPVRFRFGGSNGTLHHVWSQVHADGRWWDADMTEPQYGFGDVTEFDHYEELEIPLS